MNEVNFAAIDIGSNAVRILVKSIENKQSDTEHLCQEILYRFPLRLGEDSFSEGVISKQKIKNLIRLMKAFKQILKIYDVVDMRACATSAMRDAENGKLVVEQIYKGTKIEVEIIKGEEEAQLIYDTHIEQMLDQTKDYLYVDVGGGSTQLTLIHKGDLVFSNSFNIGTVRLMNNKVSDKEKASFTEKLKELSSQFSNLSVIGSGGNINKLYKLSRDKSQKDILSTKSLQTLRKDLSSLSIEQRMEQFKLKRERAEVIVHAADIFIEVISLTGAKQIIVPAISIGDGIIEKMYEKYKNKKMKNKKEI